jgi:hypothetical protein
MEFLEDWQLVPASGEVNLPELAGRELAEPGIAGYGYGFSAIESTARFFEGVSPPPPPAPTLALYCVLLI